MYLTSVPVGIVFLSLYYIHAFFSRKEGSLGGVPVMKLKPDRD